MSERTREQIDAERQGIRGEISAHVQLLPELHRSGRCEVCVERRNRMHVLDVEYVMTYSAGGSGVATKE